MKVVISWSGELSHKVALILKDWIPTVIQSIDTWVSSEDIAKGTRWNPDVAKALEECQFGIVCVVPGNIYEPWLNFEAGAISKSVEFGRVSPFLFGLSPQDVSGPLSQFQCTKYSKEDVSKLIHSINQESPSKPIEKEKLNRTFELCWPGLQAELDPLLPKANKLKAQIQEQKEQAEPTEAGLEEIHVKILRFFGSMGEKRFGAEHLAGRFKMNVSKMVYHLDWLEKRDYLSGFHSAVGKIYWLRNKGREYLVVNDLI